MDGRRPIILLAVALAVSGCQDEQTALMAPPDPVPAGASGADRAGPAVADSTTEAEECDLVEVEIEVEGETRTVYLCRRESKAAGGSASADGDGTQICWYWVVEYRIAGILVARTEKLLFCEDGDDQGGGGGCGGGGGGGGGQTECVSASLTLTCTTPERGSEGGCTVTVAEDDDVDESALVFAWESGFDAAWTDTTGTAESEWSSKWSGVATDDTKITVTVTGGGIAETSQSRTVAVQARTWTFDEMDHEKPPTYGIASGQDAKAWGGYQPEYADSGGIREGTGPWEGQYYTHRPIQLRGVMYLHPDFTTSGEAHFTAVGEACQAVKQRHITANVYDVNRLCGRGDDLEDWEGLVTGHEQLHEDSANKCLQSGSAAEDVLAETEAITGESGVAVRGDYDAAFEDFLNGAFNRAIVSDTATPRSPVIYEWRDHGQWTEQALDSFRHTGADGC